MQYYREYIEITDEPGHPPRVEEIRLCHDFPPMTPTDDNQVVVFDDRVALTEACHDEDWPTQTWGVLVPLVFLGP